MTSKNDITGDKLQSKLTTKEYRDGWDAIFGKAGYSRPEDTCCGKGSPCKGHEVKNQKDEAKEND